MIKTDFTMLPLWSFGYCMLACTVVVPMITWVCEITGKRTGKIFWDKLAQQSLELIWVTLAGLLAAATPLYIHFQDMLALLKKFFELQISFIFLVFFVLFLFVYQASWKKCKKQKGLHLLLGGCMALFAKATFWMACYAGFKYAQKTDLILKNPFFWINICLWILLLGATIAFACIGLYVLMRRKKDDFGRDYYRFALSFSLKCALIFFLFHFSTYIFPGSAELPLLAQSPLLAMLIFATVTGAGTLYIWKWIAFHTNPVSQKSAVLLGTVMLYGFICACLPLQASRLNNANVISIEITIPYTTSALLQNTP